MKENKSFEASMEELEKIVRELEEGEMSLDESVAAFEKAVSLVRVCNERLEGAKQKVRLLVEEKDGEFAEIPFVSEENEA